MKSAITITPSVKRTILIPKIWTNEPKTQEKKMIIVKSPPTSGPILPLPDDLLM